MWELTGFSVYAVKRVYEWLMECYFNPFKWVKLNLFCDQGNFSVILCKNVKYTWYNYSTCICEICQWPWTARLFFQVLIETECHNVTEVLHKARLNNPNTFHHIIIMFFTLYLCVSTVHVKSQHDINILNFNVFQWNLSKLNLQTFIFKIMQVFGLYRLN